jgi:hypothetical protein
LLWIRHCKLLQPLLIQSREGMPPVQFDTLLMVLASTVAIGFWPCRNPWPRLRVWNRGLLFNERRSWYIWVNPIQLRVTHTYIKLKAYFNWILYCNRIYDSLSHQRIGVNTVK